MIKFLCLLGHSWRASAPPSGGLVLVDCARCGRGPGLIALHQPDLAAIPIKAACSVLRDIYQGKEIPFPIRVDCSEALSVAATLLQVIGASGRNPLTILDRIALATMEDPDEPPS